MPSSTVTSTTLAEALQRVTLGLGLLGAPLAAQTGPQSLPAWMPGCWRYAEAGQVVDALWLSPAGGSLVGISRLLEEDTLRSWESMLIRKGGGGLVLEVGSSAQPAAAFLAVASSDSTIKFENLTHEYPQVISYSRQGRDSMLALFTGTVHDRSRTINYAYARVACPGP